MREIFHTSKRWAVHVITSAFPLVCLVCVLPHLVFNSKPVCHWTKVLPTQVKIHIFFHFKKQFIFHQLLKTRFLYLQAKNNIYIFISLDTKHTLWQTCIDTCFHMLSQVVKLEKTLQLKSTLFFQNQIWIYFFLFPLLLFIFTIIKKIPTQINEKSFANSLSALKTFPSSCFHTVQINVLSTKPAWWESSCCVSFAEKRPKWTDLYFFFGLFC